MKLLWIIGDAAAGKMTVGQELMKITDLKLFHNHMSIEPVLEIFGYLHNRAVDRIRDVIFEEFAASEQYGLIFTYMWAFDMKEDWDYVERVSKMFSDKGADIYFAELIVPQEIRIQRNVSENRLANKPSKRDIEFSQQILLHADERYRLESFDGEIPYKNYLRIDNSNISAAQAAGMIKDTFKFADKDTPIGSYK